MSDTWDSAPLAPAAPAANTGWDSAPLAAPSAQQKAVVQSGGIPDEAARALQISKQTKVPATVVQSDLPGYEDHSRQQAAVRATANPAIAKYIDGNPMAARVSADDYDKLDEVSQTLQALHPELIQSKAQGGLFAGIKEVGELLQTDAGKTKLTNALISLPYHLAKGLYDFAQVPGKVASGEIDLNTPRGLDEGIGFGLGVALSSGGRGGTVKTGPTEPVGGLTSFDDFMHTLEGMKTRKEIDDYLASKTPGPPGAMLQIEHAKAGADALDKAVEVAQDSKTKARSPETFAEFGDAHDAGSVHIDAAKIQELYQKEGKVPAEDDGLFGFVPGLTEKVQGAAATGGEVTIPVGQYIAHVDPTVHEGLKDSIRLHDDGVTIEESKEIEKEIKAFDPEAPVEPAPTEPIAVAQKDLGIDSKVFMNLLIEKGESLGITEPEFKSYSDKIARQEQAVLDKAVSTHSAEVARVLRPEWKRQEAALTTQVTEELRTQGVFAAERYLRQNKIELGGDRIAEIADDLAPLWGFESGDALRRVLTDLETVKAADNKSYLVQEREAIKAEVAQRMEAQHGNLADNIAKEARQIALADHTFDVLADEVRLLAKLSGSAPPLTRTEMVSWAQNTFENAKIGDAANWQKHQRAVARGGREAEKALLKGDFAEAFQWKQKQFLAATLAKESIKLQGLVDQTEKRIDKFQSSEVVSGVDQAHTEQVRQVLASVGLPQYHAPLADTPALREFVDGSQGQIAAAPWLMDGRQPKLEDMNVEQFRAFSDTIKSIEHAGRQATKLYNAQGEAELQNVVGDIVKSLQRFPFIDQPNWREATPMQKIRSYARKILGAHLLVERALDYTDQFNPHGPLTEWLDRPLRDANSKEITLTEETTKKLKALRGLTTLETNNPIENTLIPDALDKTGFLRMTHHELRVLMLNMGNWSNMRKLTEGFGVNEADLRRMVDRTATAEDVAYVNGIWDVFNGLKPEADAVQLRDTGVPVDHIPPVPWEIAKGKLTGGYYPLSYDPYNSDINGRVAQPLFDKGYYAATTPHRYTLERTEYSGAIDLTGTFLSSKIQGMVHDIAFREAVRNANRLLTNQEFRTAMAQYWGKEVADLMPGWLRDIANSHNLDDNYAQDFVRASALIRQNVTSTLIAFNPGTFIKHGFTAAVMSADRVGLGKLLKAQGDIGAKGTLKGLGDLLNFDKEAVDPAFMDAFRDAVQQNQRGENARQFILASSAVMRNRLRQYEDSIRGATDAINSIGVAKTLADFRQRAMQYGRLAVAFSDQLSAQATWLASYKKAYQAGESHADAVFAADKDMSRAHGSSFIGDKPLVGRTHNTITGELSRWFTGLYNFWNHQMNNNIQLVWDAAAALRGPGGGGPPGGGGNAGSPPPLPEPGANARSISRRVLQIMAIIWIEEEASAAKDEDRRGLGQRALLASLRYFGAGFIGLREITNGLAYGYEPSTGMIGTLWKAGSETVKDIAKSTGVKAGIAKNAIIHTATILGFMTGVGGSQLGRTGQFINDVATGRDRPRTFNDYRQGLRTGHSKARIHK